MYKRIIITIIVMADSKIHKELNQDAVLGLYQPPGHELRTKIDKHYKFITRRKMMHGHPTQMMKFDRRLPTRRHKKENPFISILDLDFVNEPKRIDTNPWDKARTVNIHNKRQDLHDNNIKRLGRNRFKNRYIKNPCIRNPSNYSNL